MKDFENNLDTFNTNPNQENLYTCFESAFNCLSEKLEELQFEFDTLEEMLRAAVIAQIISDETIWINMFNNDFEKTEIHRYNNYLLLLLNNLKTI